MNENQANAQQRLSHRKPLGRESGDTDKNNSPQTEMTGVDNGSSGEKIGRAHV